MHEINGTDLKNWLNHPTRTAPILLDVREKWEFDICHIKDAKLVPMNLIPEYIPQLNKSDPIICICHHGIRSLYIAQYLEQHGFTQIFNLTGGVDAWAREVDHNMPIY